MGWWSDIVDTVEDVVTAPFKAIAWFAEASIDLVTGAIDIVGDLFTGLMPDIPSSPTYKSDNPIATIQEGIKIPRAYGRVKVAGNILRNSDPNASIGYVKLLVGHCEGPIDEILAWYINGMELTGTDKSGKIIGSIYPQAVDVLAGHSYTYGTGTTTQTPLQIGGVDLFSDDQCAYRKIAVSGLRLFKESQQVGSSIPNINAIIRGMKCTPIAKNLSSTTYTWTKSSSGVSEYYCLLADSTNPNVSSPQSLYLNDVALVTAVLGSLTTGTWNYGDNDAIGFNAPYICLTQGDSDWANPTVSPTVKVIKVEEEKTFSRNPAVILWDWYRHVENYTVGELSDLDFKSLEVLCNQTPMKGEGSPIRPPGPSVDRVYSTTNYGQTDNKHAYNFLGRNAFDINKSIDGTQIGTSWASSNMALFNFLAWNIFAILGDTIGPFCQRLNVDLGVEGILNKINMINYHINGTTELDNGIKDFSIQYSSVSSDLPKTKYIDLTSSWTSIPQMFQATQYNSATPEVSYRVGGVSRTTSPYRYYSIKTQTNHGDLSIIGLRDCNFWLFGKRYTFDYIFDNDIEVNDAKKIIWSSFNGTVIRSQGKLKPVFKWHQEADGYGGLQDKASKFDFTDDDNIEKDSFEWSINERKNSIEVQYLDPNENFKKTVLKERDDKNIEQRGEEIVQREECLFITDQGMAKRRVRQRLNEFMYVKKRVRLRGTDAASKLEIFDMCTVSSILAPWTGAKDFLILSKKENYLGVSDFEMEEYYPGVFNDEEAPVPESFFSREKLPHESVGTVDYLAVSDASYWDDKGNYNFLGNITYTLPRDNNFWSHASFMYSKLESGGTIASSGVTSQIRMDTSSYTGFGVTNMIIHATTSSGTKMAMIVDSLDAGVSNQITVNGPCDFSSGATFQYLIFKNYPKGIDNSRGDGFNFDATVAEVESGDTLYIRCLSNNRNNVVTDANGSPSIPISFTIDFKNEIESITKDCKRFFPRGVYELTSAVTVPDYNITIAGVNRDAVVVRNYPASSALVFYNNTKRFELRDFSIESQNTSTFSYLINIYSDGVSSQVQTNIEYLNIEGVKDSSATDGDIAILYDNGVGQANIKNNKFNDGAYGIYFNKWNNISIDKNSSTTIPIPIVCIRTGEVIISGNNIEASRMGMFISSLQKNILISANTISATDGTKAWGSTFYGINCQAENAAITNNSILGGVSEEVGIVGIYALSLNQSTISSNIIDISACTNAVYGLQTSTLTNSTINNNRITVNNPIESVNKAGMRILNNSNNNTFSNNSIDLVNSSVTRDIGIYIFSGNDNTLIGNNIMNSGVSKIWNLGANNNIGENTEDGLNITSSDGQYSKSFLGIS